MAMSHDINTRSRGSQGSLLPNYNFIRTRNQNYPDILGIASLWATLTRGVFTFWRLRIQGGRGRNLPCRDVSGGIAFSVTNLGRGPSRTKCQARHVATPSMGLGRFSARLCTPYGRLGIFPILPESQNIRQVWYARQYRQLRRGGISSSSVVAYEKRIYW